MAELAETGLILLRLRQVSGLLIPENYLTSILDKHGILKIIQLFQIRKRL